MRTTHTNQARGAGKARRAVQYLAIGGALMALGVPPAAAHLGDGGEGHDTNLAPAEIRSCTGDCTGDGEVRINEIVTLVRAILDSGTSDVCPAGDRNGSGDISIDEVVRTVQNSLVGCESRRVDDVAAGWSPSGGPGGVVLIADRGRVVHKAAYGLADVDAGIENTTDTRFPVASVSKAFSGLSLMTLVEDGVLDYDDAVTEYLPELVPLADGLTIRHLLQHTGGLPDYFDPELFFSITGLPIEDGACAVQSYGICPAEFDRCMSASLPITPERILDVLAELDELQFPPGSSWHYSSAGSELVGLIIERVSGEAYEDFVKERVFEPAGMHRTVAGPDPDALADPDLSRGYVHATCADGFVGWQSYLPLSADLPAGGLSFSTVDDLYALDQALNAGTIVSPDTLAESVTAAVQTEEPGIRYAFGMPVVRDPNGPFVMPINGGYAGHVTMLLRFPGRQLTVIVALNREDLTNGTWQSELDLVRPIVEIYLGRANAS